MVGSVLSGSVAAIQYVANLLIPLTANLVNAKVACALVALGYSILIAVGIIQLLLNAGRSFR